MASVPDLVKVSKLETQFHPDLQHVQHITYSFGSNRERRKVRKEERWKREKKLGRGGFGVVWLEQCVLGDKQGELRVVKEVPKSGCADVNRELEAIALFSHAKYEQYFVKSFGWYDNDEDVFLTMEYFPEGDLSKYLGSPLPERDAQCIVVQILEGLQCMHDHGFAHRDLKPANILVAHKGPDWWVKIADFGISKRATEGMTALRTVAGTPAFTAPEVIPYLRAFAPSNQTYTKAVDIWSLSIITFLMLTGETPFKDPDRLVKYITDDLSFPLDTLLANKVSEQGCAFVRDLMQTKPENRPRVEKCQQHSWLKDLVEDAGTQRCRLTQTILEERLTDAFLASMPASQKSTDPQASARWSTLDSVSAFGAPATLPDGIGSTDPSASAKRSTQDQVSALRIDHSSLDSEETTEPRAKNLTGTAQDWCIVHTLKGHSKKVWSVVFSPDGKQLASGSEDEKIILWDPITGISSSTLKHPGAAVSLVYSPDGKQLASGSKFGLKFGTIRLWNPVSGVLSRELTHHRGVINLIYSLDGERLASRHDDGTIRIWDPTDGSSYRVLSSDTVQFPTYPPEGKQLALGLDETKVKLWDSTYRLLSSEIKGIAGTTESIVFSPDGKHLVFGSSDNVIRIWDPITGALLHDLRTGSSRAWVVAYSPDSRQLASGHDDGNVLLWGEATARDESAGKTVP